MILDFTKEIEALETVIGNIPTSWRMEIAMVLATVVDRGIAAEQKRIVEILKRKAMNPQELIAEIRRPQR